MEATTGESLMTGLSTLVVMLADANGTKSLGGDQYWRTTIDALKIFEKGNVTLCIMYHAVH